MLQFDSKLKVIGVLGIPDIGDDAFLTQLQKDLDALQEGGIDGLLVENLGDEMPYTGKAVIKYFRRAVEAIRPNIRVHFGVALLPHEYVAAFQLAEEFDADFAWLDTFVDPVVPKYAPVTIRPDPAKIITHKTRPVFTEVQPANFYALLGSRPIEASAQEAMVKGANSVTIVRSGAYQDDTLERVRQRVGPTYTLGITGGLNSTNIAQYNGRAQYAVVYGFFRQDGVQENSIDIKRVRELMSAVG